RRWELKEPVSDNWARRTGSPSTELATSTWQMLAGIESRSWHATAMSLRSGKVQHLDSTDRAASPSLPTAQSMWLIRATIGSSASAPMAGCCRSGALKELAKDSSTILLQSRSILETTEYTLPIH